MSVCTADAGFFNFWPLSLIMCHSIHVCICTAPLVMTNAVTGGWEEWPCCDKLLFVFVTEGPSNSSQCGAPPLRHTPLLFTITWMATDTDRWCTKTRCKQEVFLFINGVGMWFSPLRFQIWMERCYAGCVCVNTTPLRNMFIYCSFPLLSTSRGKSNSYLDLLNWQFICSNPRISTLSQFTSHTEELKFKAWWHKKPANLATKTRVYLHLLQMHTILVYTITTFA